MNFDGITLNFILKNLKKICVGTQVNKIRIADRFTLILDLYPKFNSTNENTPPSFKKSFSLIMRMEPGNFLFFPTPKFNFSGEPVQENFLLILRKNIGNSIIDDITQNESDRTGIIHFSQTTPFSGILKSKLYVEFTGKYSNIILVSGNENKISGCLTTILPTLDSDKRSLLIGLEYQSAINKNHISIFDKTYIPESINQNINSTEFIQSNFQGFSKILAEELLYRIKEKKQTIMDFKEFLINYPSDSNAFYYKSKKWISPFPLLHIKEEPEIFCDLLTLLEKKSLETLDVSVNSANIKPLKKKIKNLIKKYESTLEKSKRSVNDNGNADLEKGKTLISYIYMLKQGMSEFKIPHNINETISLNPLLSPQANAQNYFKSSKKKAKSKIINETRMKLFEENLIFLKRLLLSTELFSDKENIEELNQQLKEFTGEKSFNKTKKRLPQIQIITYKLRENIFFYVGKNDRQNDLLTGQIANREDIFMHTKDIPGAHGILHSESGEEFSNDDIIKSAEIIAFFSKAKLNLKVLVQYTPKKYIKKPKGGKTGLVILTKEKIITISPNENFSLKIKPTLFKRKN